jgi:2-amino-4-hydroxy-6-hydroxymethyldihydropteridine diphosphokinase
MTVVYLGIGGNIGNTHLLINSAQAELEKNSLFWDIKCSPLYVTAPVSDIPQADYLNAVIALKTSLPATDLLLTLQTIEKKLGKEPKPKNAPRPIDIDILFFGVEFHCTPELQIPHPRWKERFFVLKPLSDLVDEITYPVNKEGQLETLNVTALLLR